MSSDSKTEFSKDCPICKTSFDKNRSWYGHLQCHSLKKGKDIFDRKICLLKFYQFAMYWKDLRKYNMKKVKTTQNAVDMLLDWQNMWYNYIAYHVNFTWNDFFNVYSRTQHLFKAWWLFSKWILITNIKILPNSYPICEKMRNLENSSTVLQMPKCSELMNQL